MDRVRMISVPQGWVDGLMVPVWGSSASAGSAMTKSWSRTFPTGIAATREELGKHGSERERDDHAEHERPMPIQNTVPTPRIDSPTYSGAGDIDGAHDERHDHEQRTEHRQDAGADELPGPRRSSGAK